MASVTFENVVKRYGNVTAVSNLNLEIPDKEFLVFVGPSGCGKSTSLRMLAGLEDISDGTIYIGDRPVNDVPPKDRDIAMVFQSYALYPHMSVYDNMAFALKLRAKTGRDVFLTSGEYQRRVLVSTFLVWVLCATVSWSFPVVVGNSSQNAAFAFGFFGGGDDPGKILGRAHLQDDRKLVPADAAHTVASAQRARNLLRYGLQQHVPDIVAQGIVDHLEVVQVEEEHGDPGAPARGPRQRCQSSCS